MYSKRSETLLPRALAVVCIASLFAGCDERVEVVAPKEPLFLLLVNGGPIDQIQSELKKDPSRAGKCRMNGAPLLRIAAEKGRVDAIHAFIQAGANVDGKDAAAEGLTKVTPLFGAVVFAQVDAAKALLAAGADPHFGASEGISAYEIAKDSESEAIRELFAPYRKEEQ